MRKTILVVSIALTMFMCNSVSASAAICSNSPDGVHHFNDHWRQYGAGHSVYGGTHEYLYGYDAQDKPIYKNDCELWHGYQYCKMRCSYCYTEQEGMQHEHYTSTSHSVNHN